MRSDGKRNIPWWLYPIFSRRADEQQQEGGGEERAPLFRWNFGWNRPYPRRFLAGSPILLNSRGNQLCEQRMQRPLLHITAGRGQDEVLHAASDAPGDLANDTRSSARTGTCSAVANWSRVVISFRRIRMGGMVRRRLFPVSEGRKWELRRR